MAGVGTDHHFMLLHGRDPAWLGDWVRHALQAGEKVFYPVHPEGSGPPLLEVLDRRGVDVTAATAHGDLQAMPSTQYCRPGALALAVRDALQHGYPSVRVLAGIGVPLSPEAYAACEGILNDLCGRYPAIVLCPYLEEELTDEQIRRFTAWHPRTLHQSLDLRRRDRTVVLTGQIDYSNERLLRAVLHTAAAATPSALYLDVSAIALISAAGWRVLVQSSLHLRERGARLILISPRPALARMIKLLGLDIVVRTATPGGES
ncbi:STAS domain-containing protein [Actinoplanes sp. NPDC049548]|uniref:STAS domain-containing protein n=1 Tax=Actinoplanes sp. NPDC049548 TaxID=3155152 RepID=UPI00343A955B